MGRFELIKKRIECKCVIIPSRINLHCFDISRLSIFIEFLFHAPCHIAPAKQNIFYIRTCMHVLYLSIKKQLLTMAMLQGLYHIITFYSARVTCWLMSVIEYTKTTITVTITSKNINKK